MHILITGGAGYIGSHTARRLLEQGHQVSVIDNLSTGYKEALPAEVHFFLSDFADTRALEKICRKAPIDCVFHMAASLNIEESELSPSQYFNNNYEKTLSLLKFLKQEKIHKLVFSSTSSVYKPSLTPASEKATLEPQSVYSRSKYLCEKAIEDLAQEWSSFRYLIFRYFNVAGAELDGSTGEYSDKANHLVKRCSQAAIQSIDHLNIFGTDYPTYDGTCIRDYIHIKDVAQAHINALDFLEGGEKSSIFNCGYGRGFSVREVVNAMKQISPWDFKVVEAQRRLGDISQIVADNSAILAKLGWQPQYNDLDLICRSALLWELRLSQMSLKTLNPSQGIDSKNFPFANPDLL